MSINIDSDAFHANEAIPRKYSGEGDDYSPPLQWSPAPPEARQLVLVVDDPDAPTDRPFVHWVIYNIPPKVKQLPQGIKPNLHPAEPTNTAQGRNSWGKLGYGGPLPPPGDRPHHYRFHLYAVKKDPNLPAGLNKDELLAQIKDDICDEGELVGVYQRQAG